MTINGSKALVTAVPVTLNTNDILLVASQYEITNDQTYNVGIISQLALFNNEDTTSFVAQICPTVATTVSSSVQHHKLMNHFGMLTGVSGNFWVNQVTWCNSPIGSGTITIENGYVLLTAMILRR
jgi:hypothetical protein